MAQRIRSVLPSLARPALCWLGSWLGGRPLRALLRNAGKAAAIATLAAGVAGCSYLGFGGDEDIAVGKEGESAETLYKRAEGLAGQGDFQSAVKAYDEVERLHPVSTYAKKAMLRSAYAAYRSGDYDKAALNAGRYIDFYPSDENAAYAQYLIAMSQYDQINDVGRDQARTKAALQALRELINRYPDSEYAREAQIKLDLTIDHLAGKEMDIGRYYLGKGQYIGAINRFRTVVERYQTTTHTPEALHRLVEAYLALGIEKEAQTAAAVLGHNFPGSEWYQDSYALLTGRDLRPQKDDESWISQAWGSVSSVGDWL